MPPRRFFAWPRPSSCDLIVMGTHGRSGLSRVLAGSVAEEVLRKAACPVLVVKIPSPKTLRAITEAPEKPGGIVAVQPLGSTPASAH